MKKLQSIFVILIMVLILGITTSVFAVEQMELNIDNVRPFSDDNGDGQINDTYILMSNTLNRIFKIGEATNNPNQLNFSKTLYCLRFGLGFGDGTRSISSTDTTYTKLGNMKLNANTIINYYKTLEGQPDLDKVYTQNGISFTPYNSILWLIDNIALPTSQSSINKLIQNAGIENSILTTDDVDVAQQVAFWFFSNYDENFMQGKELGNVLKLSINGDIEDYISFEGNLKTRGRQIEALYTYLINTAMENGATRPNENTITAPTIALDDTLTQTVVQRDYTYQGTEKTFYVVGPFKVNITGSENWDTNVACNFGYKKTTSDTTFTEISNGLVITINNNEVSNWNYNVANGEEFYVAINKDDIDGQIVEFRLGIDYTYERIDRTGTIWTATIDDQPVLYINEEEIADEGQDYVLVDNRKPDFALRKYITGLERNGSVIDIASRAPRLNSADINAILANGTADYRHLKAPVEVKKNDIVIYTISVYNEGNIDGKVTKITDHLPEGLILDTTATDEMANGKYTYEVVGNDVIITIIDNYSLSAFTGDSLSSYSIKLACKVDVEQNGNDQVLTNIAEITEFWTATGKEDRDSTPNYPTIPSNLSNYWGKSGQTSTNPGSTSSTSYYEGREDDDDFEKVIIKGVNFDLSLRKFISSVKRNGNEVLEESREPIIDTSTIPTLGTAKYTHPKTPVVVKNGDIITYTIRVYNEGDVDGYADLITDHIPEGLEYITDSRTNAKFLWEYESAEDLSVINTSYWSKERTDEGFVNGLIKAYNPELTAEDIEEGEYWQQSENGTDGLFYRDVEIEFRVVASNTFTGNIVNIAEIADSTAVDDNNDPIDVSDNDSTEPVDLEDYPLYPAPDNSTYQEDDDDYEVVQLKYFDLALRKFITAVNDTEITGRVPEAVYNEENDQIEYVHPKTPVEVSNGDYVTYTIRVYNEGTIAGYAELISDDIPVGLVYVPANETNREFRWKMIDENGEETTNIAEAVRLTTDYLSEAHGETMMDEEDEVNPNLINPFNPSQPVSNVEPYNPDFRDVKIVFQIDQSQIPDDRVVINHAQISEDSDDDEDSTPDEWIDEDDDQDIEKVYVRIFDLSLQKWVTHTIVSVDGETVVTETGFGPNVGLTNQDGRPNSENEPVAQVVIDKNKLNSTIVKFVYAIRVANEGDIAGYATEITDYIPEGLMFVEEDNPLWTKVGDNMIITHALEETLLEPGESVVLEVVFTWINGQDNLGVKTNIAAITEDYNEAGDTPDIDSTPGNTDIENYDKEQEDDDDYALVILTLKTGGESSYIIIGLAVLAIIATGTFFIKRFVL